MNEIGFSEVETSSYEDVTDSVKDSDLENEVEKRILDFLSEASPEKRIQFREWYKKIISENTSDSTDTQPQKVLKRQFF